MALVVGLGFLLLVIPGIVLGGRAGAGDSRRGAGAGPERQRRALPVVGADPRLALADVRPRRHPAGPALHAGGGDQRARGRAAARGDGHCFVTSSVATVVALAIGGMVQLFIYPLFYCVLTVTYYDLRVRKEGFDLELLASSLQTA